MIRFLFATLFYRLANGLLFLAIAWNLVRASDNGAMSLAISSVAGFLPAVLIAPFAMRMLERVDSLKLTVAGIALLLLLSLVFVPFLKLPMAVLTVNFVLLLVFFLLDGAWDTLLATIAVQLPQAQSDTLNARQSAATQAGLMLGGVPLSILTGVGGPAAVVLCGGRAVRDRDRAAAPVVALRQTARCVRRQQAVKRSNEGEQSFRENNGCCARHGSWRRSALVCASYAGAGLVWPCLTLINMAVPLLANSYGKGVVEHAVLLDAMNGLGMAFAGLAYGVFDRMAPRGQQRVMVACAAFVPLPFVLLQVTDYALWPLAASFFLSGTGFGLFRVSVRKQLIATQPTHRVGQIVFACNAYGFPVLMVGAFGYALTWIYGPVVPLVLFAVFALAGARTMMGRRETQWSADTMRKPTQLGPAVLVK